MIPLELLLTVTLMLLCLSLFLNAIVILLVIKWKRKLDAGVDEALRGLSRV